MALPTQYVTAEVVCKSPDRTPFINVLWYEVVGGTIGNPAAEVAAFAQSLAESLAPLYQPILTTGCTFQGVRAKMSASGVVYIDYNLENVQAGSVAADELPSFCAVVIQKRTNAPGKSGRGRWYIGPVPETFANEGVVTGTAEALYEALASELYASRSINGFNYVAKLYSPKDSNLISINNTEVVPALGTQRRRRFRPGL